jgi:hypothetical protein
MFSGRLHLADPKLLFGELDAHNDELSNGETVGRFAGGEREVLRHGLISFHSHVDHELCRTVPRLADTFNNEFGYHYKATVPPSAGRSTPVMKLLSSDARNRTDG